jgi:hypothetical protein
MEQVATTHSTSDTFPVLDTSEVSAVVPDLANLKLVLHAGRGERVAIFFVGKRKCAPKISAQ